MDINTLAAWGEFLGGIAVVVSLVYLASQIRQNSRLLKASTASFTLESLNSVTGRIIDDPEVARIWWAGCEDRNSLSPPDLQRFDPLISMMISSWDQEYDFFRDNVMSERVWKRRRHSMIETMRLPGLQHWWKEWAATQHESEFRTFIDGLIREGEAAGLQTVEDIYAHFDLHFPADLRESLSAYLRKHPKDRHGTHEYALAEYGLGVADVRGRFSAYVDRFELRWD